MPVRKQEITTAMTNMAIQSSSDNGYKKVLHPVSSVSIGLINKPTLKSAIAGNVSKAWPLVAVWNILWKGKEVKSFFKLTSYLNPDRKYACIVFILSVCLQRSKAAKNWNWWVRWDTVFPRIVFHPWIVSALLCTMTKGHST